MTDPYKNFRWNLSRGNRPSSRRRGSSQILSGLDLMRD
jgi:hypothetical protein